MNMRSTRFPYLISLGAESAEGPTVEQVIYAANYHKARADGVEIAFRKGLRFKTVQRITYAEAIYVEGRQS
jgi:hypothetical protein